ncbi:MAG: hypothetical protein RL398_983 [Planctomycetota bacterium]
MRWALATVALVAWFAACSRGVSATDAPVALTRQGRLGSLRDFVLIERAVGGRSVALFFDRFEVTRGDWNEFAADAAGRAIAAGPIAGDPVLPIGGVDLRQARAFAAWRYARLPRLDEWQLAALGDGRYRYPWGSKDDPTRANTAELGLGESTPAGAFESGRRSEGGQPYDLVGNVSEWTETVPVSWCLRERAEPLGSVLDPEAGYAVAAMRVRAVPALAVWLGVGGLVPPAVAAELGGAGVPREVAGSDFQSPMSQLVEAVAAGERRSRTGIRLCAAPEELLRAMLADDRDLTALDREQLRRFLARPGHREAMRRAWRELRPSAESTIGRLLAQELQPGGA